MFAFSCNQMIEKPKININPEYSKNLKTAQTFFKLFFSEDIEAQKPLICPGVTHYPPFYGSQPGKYEAFMAAGKAWMDTFDEITYNAEVWLPGTLHSLETLMEALELMVSYGKNPMNGNLITTKAYHSFEFNPKGQIHELRDYFDASGAMAAAMKNLNSSNKNS